MEPDPNLTPPDVFMVCCIECSAVLHPVSSVCKKCFDRLRDENKQLRKLESACKELERTGWLEGPQGNVDGQIPMACYAWNMPIIRNYCQYVREALARGGES